MKCIKCGSEVKKVNKKGNDYFLCKKGHLEPRVSENSQDIHKSAGAIITNNGRILLINRRKYPFAHTIPAGHVKQGEDPSITIKREVKEETSLDLEFQFIKHYEPFYDPCRRGVDYHEWFLFKAETNNDELTMNSEGKSIGFHSPSNIKSLKLTIPTERFLKEQGII